MYKQVKIEKVRKEKYLYNYFQMSYYFHENILQKGRRLCLKIN